MLLSATRSEVLSTAERLADALVETKTETDREAFEALLIECNERIEEDLGIDYGAVCGDDGCC
ncbi:MAG: halo-CC-star protein HcsS [Halalkalicoccus sp.]